MQASSSRIALSVLCPPTWPAQLCGLLSPMPTVVSTISPHQKLSTNQS